MSTPRLVFRNASVVDPERGEVHEGQSVLVLGDRITDIGRTGNGDEVVDVRGKFLLPGLIDAHVHVNAVHGDLARVAGLPASYVALGAAANLRAMARRGFTTVRDVGGADRGLAQAVADGLVGPAPRLVHGGRALSQTGGHGDFRPDGVSEQPCCAIGRICDGETEVRVAAREEIRGGAAHLKLMLGGGVASAHDRITNTQFAENEITAAVQEAEAAGIYVTGHAYTARAIARAVRLGVRCVEHGNLLDEPTARLMAEHGTFLVPTLITYRALADYVATGEAPAHIGEKLHEVLTQGLAAVELAQRAGVRVVYGSDLLGPMQSRQLEEFALRADVVPPPAALRSATTTAAELLGLTGLVGTVAPGASADLVVTATNPLEHHLADLEATAEVVLVRGRFAVRKPG